MNKTTEALDAIAGRRAQKGPAMSLHQAAQTAASFSEWAFFCVNYPDSSTAKDDDLKASMIRQMQDALDRVKR